MHAVILAGGQGSRLRPITDTQPKPMLPFFGVPFLVGVLHRLAAAGGIRVSLLVGASKQPWLPLVSAGFEIGVDVSVICERTPLATAGACRRLLRSSPPGESVLVCNGDVLTDLDYGALATTHRDAGVAVTVALARVADPSRFGVIECDADGLVKGCVEKPSPGSTAVDTVNAGTYLLKPEVFSAFPGDGPLSFERDVLPGLLAAGTAMLGVVGDCYWQDLGTRRGYLDGHQAVMAGQCRWPVSGGLAFTAPSVAVHPTATVDPTAVLGPMAVIGAGCVIGPGASVTDSVLHQGVVVGAGARVTGTVMGSHSRLPDAGRAIDTLISKPIIIDTYD